MPESPKQLRRVEPQHDEEVLVRQLWALLRPSERPMHKEYKGIYIYTNKWGIGSEKGDKAEVQKLFQNPACLKIEVLLLLSLHQLSHVAMQLKICRQIVLH